MALYWTIDSHRRTVDVVADGDVSMGDAMAFFDAVEGAHALPYSKLLDGTQARAAMTPDDVLSIIVRIRGLHALGAMGALAAVADRPMKVFDDVKLARRWLEAQPPRHP